MAEDAAEPSPPGASDDDELAGRTYEELVAELESLTDRMASGDLGIEEAADLYERARALHAAAAGRLARVQERIERLATDERVPQDGGPVV